MITIHLPLLLFLIKAASSISVISTAHVTDKTKGSPFIVESPHALTKRAYPRPRLAVESGMKREVSSVNLNADSSREGSIHHFRDRKPSNKNISAYRLRKPSQTSRSGMNVEQPQNFQLISDTFAILETKERLTPPNIKILNQNLKELRNGSKILDLVGGGTSRLEIGLFDFLMKCFEEEKSEWWCQLYDSWHSLNSSFLSEVSKILPYVKHTKNAVPSSQADKSLAQTKAEIANSISNCDPNSRLSHGNSQTGPIDRYSPSLYIKIDSISPGIWKFCLPMENDKFDVKFLTSNPIARLSWFLDDLNPDVMIEYAEALDQNPRSLSVQQRLNRQGILENYGHTERKIKFAQATWFAPRLGWDRFQRIMLDFEKSPGKIQTHKMKLKGISQGGSRKLPKEKTCKAMEELNNLIHKNEFPPILDENLSPDIMDWLKDFLAWLNDSNVKLNRLAIWEMP